MAVHNVWQQIDGAYLFFASCKKNLFKIVVKYIYALINSVIIVVFLWYCSVNTLQFFILCACDIFHIYDKCLQYAHSDVGRRR